MSLDTYHRKRDFDRTPEPRGERAAPAAVGRFVVQRHRARALHYDFRLEIDGALASWAVPKGPTLDPSVRRMAVHVEDHPVEYADFEGTIPRGEYGAGDVIVWDRGTFEPEEETPDPGVAVRRGELKFRLHGEKLAGRWVLVRTGRPPRGGDGDEEPGWLLIKKKDEAAVVGWDPEAHPRSVKSGRTNDEVAAGSPAMWDATAPAAEAEVDLTGARDAPMPEFVPPMKATLADAAFDDPRWLFEIKWDGYRVEAVVRDGAVRLWTRNRQDAATYFPTLAGRADWIRAREAIVDGEVVALKPDGTSDFSLLQDLTGVKGPGSGRMSGTGVPRAERSRIPLAYQVFDLLYLDGRSLLDVPLEHRKRLLRAVLREHPVVRYASHVVGDGKAFMRAAVVAGVEGIVAKDARSPYEPGRRSHAWLKVKLRPGQEVVIVGYVRGQGTHADLGAVLVAVNDGGELVFAGKVGSGMDAATRRMLVQRLDALRVEQPPLRRPPRMPGVRWAEPRLVARVEFAGWTSDNLLRQPAYQGLEPDRDPASVVRERPTDADAARRAEDEKREADAHGRPPDRPAGDPPAGRQKRIPRRHEAPEGAGETVEAARATEETPHGGATARRRVPARASDAPDDGAASRRTPPRARKPAPTGESAAAPGIVVAAATDAELAAFEAVSDRGGTWVVGGREVSLTNLDRRLFPSAGLVKRDLIRYYVRVAPTMLPYLAGRALNLSRWPQGVGGPHFWQKELPEWAPSWLARRFIAGSSREESHTYVIADHVATLAWLANQAAIEIHPWTSPADRPDEPSYALVDIDPGERTTWDETLVLARLYREALRHLGVRGSPKVTGKRGIQVWIPVRGGYTFDQTRTWVEAVSRIVGRAVPDLVSWEWETSRRQGRARLDYTQNAVNKTLVAPYAARATQSASVSMPIRWEELDDPALRPDRWTIGDALERIGEVGDLFGDALGPGQDLPAL